MSSKESNPQEDVVISGVSCRLPESENVEEFWENLVNGTDMVTEDDRRWPPGIYDLPRRNGKIPDISSFDAEYFGITPKQADCMDPQLRLLLEVAYEAVMDSGCSFKELSLGTTGVFIGSTFNDGHDLLSADQDTISGYEMTGGNRTMLANRLSYFFDLKGPSMSVDTACSSGLQALCLALSAIREGRCDRALVGACNLLLKPETSLQFMKLKMLSPDGTCKSFDSSADGYCRSEGVVVMLVEKENVSLKSYLTVVDALDGSDGYKQQGISYPSNEAQRHLLQTIYSRSNVDPKSVSFVEAHGTGTAVGDPVELNTIASVMGSGRKQPLLVGSVKSNMGHSEACAGLAAILKIILAHYHHTLPKNLHFIEPNPEIPSLRDGRLRVVDKNMAWEGGTVGINSFGFGGANVHVIVKTPTNPKDTETVPKSPNPEIPLLILCSGNTQETVANCLSGSNEFAVSDALRGMLEKQAGDILNYQPARGFSLPDNAILETCLNEKSSERPLWYIYPGMGTQWPGMGRELMSMSTFKDTIIRCHNALKPEGFDLMSLIESDADNIYDDPQNAFVAICAIQLAFTRVLLRLDLKPDGMVGHSVGELGCAYADGTLTVEQTIAAAYWRGRCIKEANLPNGSMAAVGLTWEECKKVCPEGVVPACHNAKGTVTVSGPSDEVQKFVESLKSQGIFAREVNSSGVAFHSYFMKPCAPTLKESLQKIIPKPVKRSHRWVSSSIPESEWKSSLGQYSSPEYHVNNLVSPVLFQEALQRVPDNAILIEIGPHALLQAVLKRELSKSIVCLSTMKKLYDKNMQHFLINIGRCYMNGKTPDIAKLYGPAQLHTSKLPMLCNYVQWSHKEKWHVPSYKRQDKHTKTGYDVIVDITQEKDVFLHDHVIDGRIIYPAAGFLVMAWEALAYQIGVNKEECDVTVQGFKIHEASIIKADEKYIFKVQIAENSGKFEITEGKNLKCSGVVKTSNPSKVIPSSHAPRAKKGVGSNRLDKTGFYQELRLRGYDYGPAFQCVQFYGIEGSEGSISFNNWVSFIDSMLHVMILKEHPQRSLKLPTRIKELHITPSCQTLPLADVDIYYEKHLQQVKCEIATMRQVTFTTSSRKQNLNRPVLEKYIFQPYIHLKTASLPNIPNEKGSSTENNELKLQSYSSVKDELQPVLSNGHDHNSKSESNMKVQGKNDLQEYSSESVWSQNQTIKPDFEELDMFPSQSLQNVRVMLDIATENLFKQRLTVGSKIETQEGLDTLSQLIDIAQSFPHIQFQFWTIASDVIEKSQLQSNYSSEDLKIVTAKDAHKSLVQNTDILFYDTVVINGMLSELNDQALILLQTSKSQADAMADQEQLHQTHVNTIARREQNTNTTLMLLKFCPALAILPHVIYVQNTQFQWVEKLKEKRLAIAGKENERIWLVSTRNKATGLIGLINCLLQEPNASQIRCLMNYSSEAPSIPEPLLPGNEGFDDLVQRDVVMNVYRDGVFGSFRKTHIVQSQMTSTVQDVFLDIPIKGDLGSLEWIEMSPKDNDMLVVDDVIDITHSALNFRDVMVATGRLAIDALPGTNDTPLGLEFAGVDKNNGRVMGINMGKSLASRIKASSLQVWNVPENWTLAEAATVPIAYMTAYYSLLCRANIQPGDRVMIHSATSAVGQAAVRIAMSTGCDVYATAGTQTKRQYLATACGVKLTHIANSRDLSFVSKFLESTDGEGMDVVLNALADEKLMASLDLLAENGTFLEIGKYDLSEDTKLGLSVFLKNISFHGIQVEQLFIPGNKHLQRVHRMLEDGIARGVVVPLKHTVFHHADVEAAFRHMAEGVHIGKIVIQMRNMGKLTVSNEYFFSSQGHNASRRTYFHPNKVYIITGGLGGLGMELANWLIQRGASHLILTSRKGLTTGYQHFILKRWQAQGACVVISTRDVQIEREAQLLIEEAMAIGPLGGVFHLAAVLHDAHFDVQTAETFQRVCDIKVKGIDHLDRFTRQIGARTLDYFVAFSSAAAGFGNAGQTNYGFANSYMERVCEDRVRSGYPGKAIQWGFIGDVGIVQNTLGGNSLFHMGMVPQRIPSFLEVLDLFLLGPATVYSSVVPAPRVKTDGNDGAPTASLDVVDQAIGAVAKIIGVKDISTMKASSPLVELGLDSLMATEIRQVFGRRFDLQLSVAEVQTLTLDGVKTLFGK